MPALSPLGSHAHAGWLHGPPRAVSLLEEGGSGWQEPGDLSMWHQVSANVDLNHPQTREEEMAFVGENKLVFQANKL